MIQTTQALAKLKLLQVNKPGETPRNPGIKDVVYLTGHGPINFRVLEKILKTLNQTGVKEFRLDDAGALGTLIGFFWPNPFGRESSIAPAMADLSCVKGETISLTLD